MRRDIGIVLLELDYRCLFRALQSGEKLFARESEHVGNYISWECNNALIELLNDVVISLWKHPLTK